MVNVLNYSLHENKLTEDPDDCYAIPEYTGSVTEDDLIDEMTASGSTLTKGEATLFLQQYKQAIRNKLLAGYTINTSLFNISARIAGVFKNKNDRFDVSRHAVYVNTLSGTELKEMERDFNPAWTETTKPLPTVDDFKDISSNLTNQIITIGGVGHITGRRLTFDLADATQGIFFIDESGLNTRVTTMVRQTPSDLIFMIPATLSAVNYFIEVRTIPKGNKDLRIGRYQHQLAARQQ
jgi:hypothetical protein